MSNIKQINNFKIRGGYGILGNEQITSLRMEMYFQRLE